MTPKSHILLDACVARSISDRNSEKLPSTHKIISTLRNGETGLCMTPELQAEWQRHATRFMTRWLAMMEQRCRVRRERDRRISDLRDAVSKFVQEAEKRRVILKDIHITEAAILLGFAVFSFDDKQRRVLLELSSNYQLVGSVQWFNPESDAGESMNWLEGGGVNRAVCRLSVDGQ